MFNLLVHIEKSLHSQDKWTTLAQILEWWGFRDFDNSNIKKIKTFLSNKPFQVLKICNLHLQINIFIPEVSTQIIMGIKVFF